MKNPVLYGLWSATLVVAGVAVWRLTGAQGAAPAPAAPSPEVQSVYVPGPIQPIPAMVRLDPKKVELGRRLFHEARFSSDGKISCASCHDLSKGGDDDRRVSVGADGQEGELNAPTVFNCGFNFRQFWDGRAGTLEEQVPGPIHSPKEMGSSWEKVLSVVKGDASYVTAFAEIYPDGATADTVTDAVATFERSLYTPGSRFDQYLMGKVDALSPDEVRGYQLFLSTGCVTCHQGVNVGGNMFQTLGKVRNFFEDRGGHQPRDLGRFNVTGLIEDRFLFKVPTLRNVELTAPYLHDGSVKSLNEVIQLMARYELGTRLQDVEVDLIAKFLHTLTAPPAAPPR